MLIKDVMAKTTQFLKDKGSESPRLDTELLISAALNWDRMKLYLNYEYPLSETELSACREFVRRRASGEPVAYILERKDFYNHTFYVTPAVFVPRPETETLVEETANWLRSENIESPAIIDLGTGSGCIGLSLLAENESARLLAVDVSSTAVDVATENARRLGLSERAEIVVSDASQLGIERVMDSFGRLADAVVANPPYIAESDPAVEPNVRKHEPATALFSKDDGLAHIRGWAEKSLELVRSGGWVMFEIGQSQGQEAKGIFESLNRYKEIKIVKDLSGRDRFVRALKIEES